MESEGSCKQNTDLTNRNHIRGGYAWIRRHFYLKSKTHTEGINVYVASISVKVLANYPGRPDILFWKKKLLEQECNKKRGQESAEVIVGVAGQHRRTEPIVKE